MASKALAVYLIESGRSEVSTDKVDILTPKDADGVEMVISVDAEYVTVSRLLDAQIEEKIKITLDELK